MWSIKKDGNSGSAALILIFFFLLSAALDDRFLHMMNIVVYFESITTLPLQNSPAVQIIIKLFPENSYQQIHNFLCSLNQVCQKLQIPAVLGDE